jgi:hypothetical protein
MQHVVHLQQLRPATTPRLRQVTAATGSKGSEQARLHGLLTSA